MPPGGIRIRNRNAVDAIVVVPPPLPPPPPPPTVATSPLADRIHPRIWIVPDYYINNGQTVSEIRARLTTYHAPKLKIFMTMLDALYGSAETDAAATGLALGYAFCYALDLGDRPIANLNYIPQKSTLDYGTKARVIVTKILVDARQKVENKILAAGGTVIPDVNDRTTDLPCELSIAYDWTAALWSATERAVIFAQLEDVIYKNKGYGLHDHGEQTDWSRMVIHGLAFADDGVNDARAREMYLHYTQDLAPEKIGDVYDAWAPDGGYVAGASYAVHSNQLGLINYMQMTEAWRTANNLTRASVYNVAGHAGIYRNFPYYLLHWIHPNEIGANTTNWIMSPKMDPGQGAGEGDGDSTCGWMKNWIGIDNTTASLARWLQVNHVGIFTGNSVPSKEKIVEAEFLWPEATLSGPKALGIPTSRFFSSVGYLAGRTAWEDLGATAFMYEANEFSTGSAYMSASGSLQISRNGPLIVHAGEETHHSYSNWSVAASAMIFPDTTYPERMKLAAGVGTVTSTGTTATFSSSSHSLRAPTTINPDGSTADAIRVQVGTASHLRRVTAINVGGNPNVVSIDSAFPSGVTGLAWERFQECVPPIAILDGWDMGMQRLSGINAIVRASDATPSHNSYLGGVTRHNVRAGNLDYDYAYSLNTNYFNAVGHKDSQNTAKLTSWTRQFVSFGRPVSLTGSDYFVVFDRVTVPDVKFEKRLVLHSAGPNRSMQAVNGTESLVRAGRWEFDGADLITLHNNEPTNNFQGKAFVKILGPDARIVTQIGGQGTRMDGVAGNIYGLDTWGFSNENPYGANFGSAKNGDAWNRPYAGTFRVEIRHRAALSAYFLLAIEVGTFTGLTSMVATSRVDGTNFVGAAIGTRIAAFSTSTSDADQTSGSIVLPSAAVPTTYKILLSNVTGLRALTGGANISGITAVDGGGSSPFQATDQRQIYANATVAANGTIAERTLSIS